MTIAILVESIRDSLSKVIQAMEEFPSAVEVATSEGGTSTVTKPFRDEVTMVAQEMGQVTQRVVSAVNNTHDEIRAAVKKLMEIDEEFADDGRRLLLLLESAQEHGGGSGEGTYG